MTNLKTQLRGGFSDRNKINSLNTEIQIRQFNERTRNKIANLVRRWFETIPGGPGTQFYEKLVDDVFGECITDEVICMIKYQNDDFASTYIYSPILNNPYDDVLTIVEYIAGYISSLRDIFLSRFGAERICHYPDCKKEINDLFEQEFVGYRMIDRQINPISGKIEVNAINEALSNPFDGPRSHIKKALTLLSDREKPDYKNSIKESISAVESICQIIVNDNKVSLGQAINKLRENSIEIHPAFEEAIKKLYGYTSDKGGIRHAEGVGESDVSFAETKYSISSGLISTIPLDWIR